MDLTAIQKFYRQYGELLLHLLVLLSYFLTINVQWTKDWSDWAMHKNGIRPISALVFPLVFYLNAFWLVPQYLKKQRWLQYGLLVSALALVLEVGRSLLFAYLDTSSKTTFSSEFLNYKHAFDAIGNGILLSFAYVMVKDWMVNRNLIERLRAEKLEAELAFLKSQVDPHFLFNTLNSLYSLALEENSDHTADGIAKLGTLMRYNLHDSKAEFILLSKEIDYIKKYIELQELRTTPQNEISLTSGIEETTYRNIKIAPMLLISFVENAFKYGISPTEKTFIKIDFTLNADRLKMQIQNSIIANAQEKDSGGVGLQNVKKRLQLIYPERHQLFYEKRQNTFYVTLEINLKP